MNNRIKQPDYRVLYEQEHCLRLDAEKLALEAAKRLRKVTDKFSQFLAAFEKVEENIEKVETIMRMGIGEQPVAYKNPRLPSGAHLSVHPMAHRSQ